MGFFYLRFQINCQPANLQIMKKILITQLFLSLFLPIMTFGQLDKGMYLGAFSTGFAYNYFKYTFTNYSSAGDLVYKTNSIDFTFNSSLGYFVVNRLAMGPGIFIGTEYIQYSDYVDGSVYKTHSTIYSVAFNPFLRYYFAKQGKVAFFVLASGVIGYGQNYYSYPDKDGVTQKETTSIFVYGGGAGLGLVYFITKNIGLETQLSYNFRQDDLKKDVHKTNTVNSAITLGAGISCYFNRK